MLPGAGPAPHGSRTDAYPARRSAGDEPRCGGESDTGIATIVRAAHLRVRMETARPHSADMLLPCGHSCLHDLPTSTRSRCPFRDVYRDAGLDVDLGAQGPHVLALAALQAQLDDGTDLRGPLLARQALGPVRRQSRF
jgi:hypothetical protein